MGKYILGKKLGMTTIYDKERGALNVTMLDCQPNRIALIRTVAKDGYSAVQLETSKTKKRLKLAEFRIDSLEGLELGAEVTVDNFTIGSKVKISGVSKAKGFQGVVKRHGFAGSPKTHGHKHDLRAPGSIGAQQPQHVIKGKRMAGRMGGRRASAKNVKVVFVDKERNLLGVLGAVPGVAGRIVEIRG